MRIAKLVTLLLTVFLYVASLYGGQEADYGSGAIKTDYGFLLVWNAPNNHYTLEIKGTNVRQTSTEHVQFTVDGIFLQIVNARIKDFVDDAQRKKMDERAILEVHRDWEVKYLTGDYKESLKVESSWQPLSSGKTALSWSIVVPASARGNVKKQTSLTVVKGDFVLMLGSVVTDTIQESTSRQLLMNTAETLKPSDQPIDLRKLQEQIRAAAGGSLMTEQTLGETAVDVIRTKYSGSLDDYVLLICTSKEQAALAKDSDAGAFVRQMMKGKNTLAVIALPSQLGKGPAFGVYFDGNVPVGIAMIQAADGKKINDDIVTKAYVTVSGAVQRGNGPRPIFEEGTVEADDGTKIRSLQIVRWQ
jgi:hypothetical protein